MAPAKMSIRVKNATTFVKRRSQTGVDSRGRLIRKRYTSLRRGLSCRRVVGEPFLEVGLGVDGVLAAHAVVAEAAELGAGDLEAVAARLDRREVDGDFLPRDGVLFHAHVGEEEAV